MVKINHSALIIAYSDMLSAAVKDKPKVCYLSEKYKLCSEIKKRIGK